MEVNASFSLTARTLAQIEYRLDPDGVLNDVVSIAERDLGRYYALLGRQLNSLKGYFTPNEWGLIADYCNGAILTESSISLFVDSLIESMETDVSQRLDQPGWHTIAEKWKVDETSFRDKLHRLTQAQIWALVDAMEQAWVQVSKKSGVSFDVIFESLGLLTDEPAGVSA